MARITVEDCLDNVENRFELVLVATKRARQIALGAEPMVTYDKDKPTVIALREIAEGLVTNEILDEPDTPVLDFGEEFTGLGADAELTFDLTGDSVLESSSANEDADATVEVTAEVAAAEVDENTGAETETASEDSSDPAAAAEDIMADSTVEDFSAALDAALKEELKPDGDTSPAEDSTE